MSDKVIELWRPFIAEAPDMNFEVKSGDALHIPMSDYMRQGAVALDDYHSPLDVTKDPLFSETQIPKRGWLFNLAITTQPSYGKVVYDEHRRGFVYTSDSDYIGEDCFNYVLTNGKQVSYTGKVNIDVKENYRLILTADQNRHGEYRITAKVTSPEGEPPASKIYYQWDSVGPYIDTSNRVAIGNTPIYNTAVTRRGYGNNRVYIVVRVGNVWGFEIPIHESDFEGLLDSRTGEPFMPIDRFNDFEVEARLRLGSADWGDPVDLVLTARLSDFYGRPWEKSGQVLDPDKPDQNELEGNTQPDYMKIVPLLSNTLSQVPDVK